MRSSIAIVSAESTLSSTTRMHNAFHSDDMKGGAVCSSRIERVSTGRRTTNSLPDPGPELTASTVP